MTDYPNGVYEGRVIWEKEFELEAEDFDGAEVWEEMRGALTADCKNRKKPVSIRAPGRKPSGAGKRKAFRFLCGTPILFFRRIFP